MNIQYAKAEPEIRACFHAFSELRPHLTEDTFVSQVERQMRNHDYTLVYILDQGQVVVAAGYRVAEFLAWGITFYLDDLITVPAAIPPPPSKKTPPDFDNSVVLEPVDPPTL